MRGSIHAYACTIRHELSGEPSSTRIASHSRSSWPSRLPIALARISSERYTGMITEIVGRSLVMVLINEAALRLMRGAANKRLCHIDRRNGGGSGRGLQTSRHRRLIAGLADSKLNVKRSRLTRIDM